MAQDINIKMTVDTSQAQSSTDNYKKRLKELKDEMTKLQIETDGLSKASAEQRKRFSELSNEAGKIQDAMSDTAQQVKNLSDDYQSMTAALEGVSGAVGGITAVSGAMSLFGVESEKANETIKKMTSLMAILQGIQQVQKTLNKDSALMTALRAKSQKSLNNELAKTTSAETAGTAATATFTAAEGAATTGAITLKGAVKAVGAAIKSIPVIGWILAAISAIITLISLISDANDEEEKGNELLEERKQKIKEIEDAHRANVKAIQEENNELSKLLESLGNGEGALYEDAVKALASYTGVAEEYLRTLSEEEAVELKTKVLWYKQYKEEVENLQRQLDEGLVGVGSELSEIQQKIWKGQATIKKYEDEINAEREKGYKYIKEQEARTKALEEAERKHKQFIEDSKRELQELNNAIYGNDDEEQITEKYDKLLDLAIKYYGEESEQVAKVSEMRLKALEELKQKEKKVLEELAKQRREDERKDIDSVLNTETVKLQTQLIALGKNSKAYFDKKQDIDRANELKELEELKRKYEDELITFEEYEATKDYITAEHAQARADILNEYANVVAEHQKQLDEEEQARTESRWQMAQSFVSAYSNFVNSAMEAELAAVGDNEAEQKRIRKKYARSRFISQIADIGVSTGQAIMGAWASASKLPYPVNLILGTMMTALMTATGGAQIASATQQMDKAMQAARGGILGGQSHANGGTMLSNGVEAERGEAIINKRSTAAFAPLLSEINSYRGYGAPLISSSSSSSSMLQPTVSDETIQRIVSATVQGIASIPVVVSEHAITEAQRTVGITRERSFI